MQGTRKILLGLVLAAAGAVVLYIMDDGDPVPKYGGWGLFGVGILLVVVGLYRDFLPGSKGVNAGEAYHADTIARLLMQSTITTALSDGHLKDEEIEMIVTACEEVLHEHLDKDSIRRLADTVAEQGESILDEIHEEGRLLNVKARKSIIEACVLVLMADGVIDERETAAVTAIARHMDYSEAETQALIAAAIEDAKA